MKAYTPVLVFILLIALFFSFNYINNNNVLAAYPNPPYLCQEDCSQNGSGCQAGLSCVGGKCVNANCSSQTDCICAYTVQGFKTKLPGNTVEEPFSSQTVTKNGGSGTTANPYSFTNLKGNNTIAAPSLSGSSLGYTLCYNSTTCHSVAPTPGSSVSVSNPSGVGQPAGYADLWWHYTPQIPNCKSVSGSTTLVKGDPYTFSATYENYNANLDNAWMVVIGGTNCSDVKSSQSTGSGTSPGVKNFNWTPSTTGTHTIYCRADSTQAQAMGYCTGSPPQYNAAGPNTTLTVNVITPTLYPTVSIQGNYQEDTGTTGNVCQAPFNPTVANLDIGIAPAVPAGVTPVCTKNATSYSCTVTFDNQNTPSVDPSQDLTFSGSYPNYSPVTWRGDNTSNSCSDSDNNVISVDVSDATPQTTFNKDIFFKYSSTSWFKLRGSGFNSRTSRNNVIPFNIQAYDADDSTDKYLAIQKVNEYAGAVVSNGNVNLGGSNYSSPNWNNMSYETRTSLRPSFYLSYVKSRKEYVSLSPANNLDDLEQNKINFYSGNLSIDSTAIANKITAKAPLILLVEGDVTVDINNKFNSGKSSVAIISTGTITFSDQTIEANGIFVGQNVTIEARSPVDTSGLKINGNLVSINTLVNNRTLTSNTKPTFFINFNPGMYVDLLDNLSTATYNWQQLK